MGYKTSKFPLKNDQLVSLQNATKMDQESILKWHKGKRNFIKF